MMATNKELLAECKALDSQGLQHVAIRRLTEAIASSPTAELHHERGTRYEQLGEYELALEDYSRAVVLDPRCTDYWLSRGQLLCDRFGCAHDAVDDFEKAMASDTSSPIPHQCMSMCYSILGSFELAAEHAERAIRRDTADACSYYCLGKSYVVARDFDSAARQFQIALQHDPQASLYWDALGDVHFDCGNYRQAKDCYATAVELSPSASIYIRLARIQLNLGETEGAIQSLTLAKGFDLNEGERALVEGYSAIADEKRKG